MTREFALEGQDSIARGDQLILPKLFRRSDYLKAVVGGYRGTLDGRLVDV